VETTPEQFAKAMTFSLTPGQARDAPEGRALLNRLDRELFCQVRDDVAAGGSG
jgi:hypothetical protein